MRKDCAFRVSMDLRQVWACLHPAGWRGMEGDGWREGGSDPEAFFFCCVAGWRSDPIWPGQEERNQLVSALLYREKRLET